MIDRATQRLRELWPHLSNVKQRQIKAQIRYCQAATKRLAQARNELDAATEEQLKHYRRLEQLLRLPKGDLI